MTKAFALGRAVETKGIKDTRGPAGYSDKDEPKCDSIDETSAHRLASTLLEITRHGFWPDWREPR